MVSFEATTKEIRSTCLEPAFLQLSLYIPSFDIHSDAIITEGVELFYFLPLPKTGHDITLIDVISSGANSL
jgi:hypothetical protein